MREVLLGSEADDALFERLRQAINALGGSIKDKEWSLGGPREVARYEIALPKGTLEAIAETDTGLTLRGTDSLVAEICALL